MNKKTASLAFALVLAASALGVGVVRSRANDSTAHGPAAAAATAAAEGASAAAAPSVPGASARDMHLGASFTYELASTRGVADATGRALTTTKIGGRLTMTVVGAKNGGAAVRAQLAAATREDAPATDEKAQDLETAFFFVLGEDGTIQSFGFPRAMHGDARRQLRALVSSLQLAPASGERVESDASGELVASYAKSGDRVTKTKVRYERVRTPGGLVSPRELGGDYTVQGASTIAVDASGWPSSVDEVETVKAVFQAGAMMQSAKTTARLVAKSEDKSLAGSYDAAASAFDPDVDALGEAAALARRNADLGMVKGATYASLMSDLTTTDQRAQHRTVARMGALFRTNPDAVNDARATLLAKGTPDATAKNLVGALGNAGTPEAQKALGDALRSDVTSLGTKTAAAAVLGLVKEPTPEAKDALSSAAQSKDPSLSTTANLALGNLAKSAGDSAGDVVTDLLAKLDAASTSVEKAHYLDALGNSGSPRAQDAILAYTKNADSMLRAAALAALRFQDGAPVVEALVGGLLDPDANARRAALSAIGQKDVMPFVEAFDAYVKRESDPQLRVLAVRVLSRSVNVTPAVETVLSWLAAHDEDADVRNAATEALSKPKAPPVR